MDGSHDDTHLSFGKCYIERPDPKPREGEADFNAWYDEEHLGILLKSPYWPMCRRCWARMLKRVLTLTLSAVRAAAS